MEAKQLQSLRAHSEQMAGFVVRLSNYYEGLSTEIDKELQGLRNHLSGKIDFTLATISMNKVSQLIMLEPHSVKSLTQAWLRQLDEDIQTFQRLVHEPTAKTQAAKVSAAIKKPVSGIGAILPLYQQVLTCYKMDMGTAEDAQPESPAADASASKRTVQLKQNLIDELGQLVQTYIRVNPEDEYIASLEQRLGDGLTEEELLNSCLILIRVMVQETLTEANTAGKIIQRLNNALGNMNGDVQSSISKSAESFEARQSRQQELRSVLEDMEDALEGDHTVDELKKQAQHYLGQMANSLTAGEEAERMEQEGLMSLLVSMQQQLSSLQKQTDSYRKKLVEQRINMYTDPLTRVPNRMAYNERANKEWERCQAQDTPLSIAVVDVDHFKRINDKYGHAAGDKTLQAIARHLKSNLNSSEFVARWGGEEFIILLPDHSSDKLQKRLNELREGLAKLPFKFKQERLTVTASIGGTQCRHGEKLDSAFERADKCLYKAKSCGRNQVVIQDTE
ncbi:GGDEF domain-containing protein [Alteromonas lipolytica]|uniref:diguanylate cyclase n=1 Tax=Alteromonas lipolytica TaxID=1856405 RepID=A0A1E8FDU6_9ALTE|nr:GGDEF domain-containing protein [Alteromonas lipolytica]OFI34117.1 hypothetical protein BFC17_21470 [Alteromonas lipolytica]GGF65253.1 diguanylate cyclase [Alteromonas lipolytica]